MVRLPETYTLSPWAYSVNVFTLSSAASARMWFWVGPTNAPPDSITEPLASVWLSTRPPTRSRASSSTTDRPARAIARAATSPEMPAPATTTSTVDGRLPLVVAADADPGP